ncbi:tRNA (uracil-O(2)-)-methyltransferase [Apiospora hydei]|uniref:tRNA (uracil-O(2)-)-methyltransferase n=1 Tax=Apiospora hydei TaxID=1337664 RepID=A0ABR1VI12_9PEZI
MGFEPTQFECDAAPLIRDVSGAPWTPLFWHACTFDSTAFTKVMMNLIRNPNINSSWLFRADVLYENGSVLAEEALDTVSVLPRPASFAGFDLEQSLVRKLIPRNALRDQPLDQTCLFYRSCQPDDQPGDGEQSMVIYIPHVSSPSEMPFYHPAVRGVAFLHEWNRGESTGRVSTHYCFFDDVERSPKLVRTAFHLLSTLHKHGQGTTTGYVKRVHHDVVVPQITMQTTYAKLKEKYARRLINTWAEVTDPTKHVFEDLGIAAFLIELWRQMYQGKAFPGFVDIGCGNGLLVYLLRQEGYEGWGFDARERKSWANYNVKGEARSDSENMPCLREHVLLPSIITTKKEASESLEDDACDIDVNHLLHDGLFPKGTFIISNHADELTPWTPILAAISDCPFMMIPCCSHNLTGAKYRAPVPKGVDKSNSAYASLVAWVSGIADDCGWEVETEMLRIPSTRNTAMIGRKRKATLSGEELDGVVQKYGGTAGYLDNVMKLVKVAPRSH